MANLIINKWDVDKLVNNLFIIFLSNSFLVPLAEYFNPLYYWLLFQRKYLTKGKTQRELNLIFENPPMNISLGYSHIFQTILTTVFFAALFPLGSIISFVGMLLTYFIDKVRSLIISNKFYLLFSICWLIDIENQKLLAMK